MNFVDHIKSKYYFIHIMMEIPKNKDNSKCWEECGELKPSYITWRNVK
jgi:hypothetical protein